MADPSSDPAVIRAGDEVLDLKSQCTRCGFIRRELRLLRHGQYGICPQRRCRGLMCEPKKRTFFAAAVAKRKR